MTSISGSTRQSSQLIYTDALDLSTPTDSFGQEWNQVWTAGTGNLQANRLFHDSRAISAIDNLDLFGGLTDAFGNTLSMTSVKELAIRNRSTTIGETLHIGGTWFLNSVLTGWADDPVLFILERGATMRWSSPNAGWAVADTTKDILSVTPVTGTITYEIWILGTE